MSREAIMPRLLILLFWATCAFTLVMALLPQPPQLPGSPSDKVQHVAAFLVLTSLAIMAYPRVSLLRIGLLMVLFGLLIELLQLIPALNRDGSALDWLADGAAVAAVLGTASLLRRIGGLAD
jgi:VanZ family protein